MSGPLTLTPTSARRLAVAAQLLDKVPPEPTVAAAKEILSRLRCLQLDPIRAVERTQYLVLWSRLGCYDPQLLHNLQEERFLFEYWAHAASLVLTEDYPIHEYLMRRYGEGNDGSAWSKRLHHWVQKNEKFRRYILQAIHEKGPLLSADFEDKAEDPWGSNGWTSGRSVAYMLDYLWTKGQILVTRRDGLKRWWDLAERVLPASTPSGGWSEKAITREAAQFALLALGIGRERDIKRHFTEGRYPRLKNVLAELADDGIIVPARIEPESWGNGWYIHRDLLKTLETVRQPNWRGRTTVLSPFDNLIRDRDRTELMWNFLYRIEIYVPKRKRQYGYYVLPILHDDRLIGRIDPRMDRKKGILHVQAIYLEQDFGPTEETGLQLAGALEDLAHFLGARRLEVTGALPGAWQRYICSREIGEEK